jgi:hypothetical protein
MTLTLIGLLLMRERLVAETYDNTQNSQERHPWTRRNSKPQPQQASRYKTLALVRVITETGWKTSIDLFCEMFSFYLRVLKCGAGEGWRRLVGPITWEMNYSFRVKKQRNILPGVSKRKANWIGHILRKSCLLQQVIEGKVKGGIEVTGRRWRKRRKLLDDLKERRGYSHLNEEALDRTMWTARFGRGFGPVVRETAKWMNDEID